jgi:hypothetical protein
MPLAVLLARSSPEGKGPSARPATKDLHRRFDSLFRRLRRRLFVAALLARVQRYRRCGRRRENRLIAATYEVSVGSWGRAGNIGEGLRKFPVLRRTY